MAPEMVTEMVLNVDLKCSGCYKKVKKVIWKIPQIRDQVFDVDKNKVKVTVVCCSPEKIRDKLCYKGGGAIQSIEIVEKPKPADKPKEPEKSKPADKPKEPEKSKPADKSKPKPADKPKDVDKPKEAEKAKPDKSKELEKPKPADKTKELGKPKESDKSKLNEADKPPQPKDVPPKKVDAGPAQGPGPGPGPSPSPDVAKMMFEPVHGYPQMYPPSAYPMMGYGQYYDQGYGGAPFQHGYGMPVAPPPPPSYNGFRYEYGYNGNRSYHTSNDYVGEENSEGCSIM